VRGRDGLKSLADQVIPGSLSDFHVAIENSPSGVIHGINLSLNHFRLCVGWQAEQCGNCDKEEKLRRFHGFGSSAAKPLSKQKGRDLLTPRYRHRHAFNRTLSDTPVRGVHQRLLLSPGNVCFVADSSRSRKLDVVCFLVFNFN